MSQSQSYNFGWNSQSQSQGQSQSFVWNPQWRPAQRTTWRPPRAALPSARSRSPHGAAASRTLTRDTGRGMQQCSQASAAEDTVEDSEVPMFSVSARLMSGRELASVKISARDPMAKVRRAAATADGCAANALDLIFNGRFLADRETAGSIGLQPDAELMVVRAKPFEILLSTDNHTAELHDGVTGNCVQEFRGHRNGVRSAVFSSNGKLVLTASDDFFIKIFDPAVRRCVSSLKAHHNNINCAVFSPADDAIITASDDGVAKIFWISPSYSGYALSCAGELRGHRNVVNSAVFSAQGLWALTASDDESAKVFNVQTRACLQTFQVNAGAVYSAVFSYDSSRVLTACEDSTVRLFKIESGECERIFPGHTGAVRCVAFSPDGLHALSASEDHTAKVFSLDSGDCKQTLTGEGDSECHDFVVSAAFSSDGDRVLTASDDGWARLFNAETGQCLRTFRAGSHRVNSAVFAPTPPESDQT